MWTRYINMKGEKQKGNPSSCCLCSGALLFNRTFCKDRNFLYLCCPIQWPFTTCGHCEWKRGNEINLTSSVAESNLTGWSDHTLLIGQVMVDSHNTGTLHSGSVTERTQREALDVHFNYLLCDMLTNFFLLTRKPSTRSW